MLLLAGTTVPRDSPKRPMKENLLPFQFGEVSCLDTSTFLGVARVLVGGIKSFFY